MRDLSRSREHNYLVVGFADDDPRKIDFAWRPAGPGEIALLPKFIGRHDVSQVLIAIPSSFPEKDPEDPPALLSRLKVHFKIIPVSLNLSNDRATASMLRFICHRKISPARRPRLLTRR